MQHLQTHAPDLLMTLQRHGTGYLFIVITPTNA